MITSSADFSTAIANVNRQTKARVQINVLALASILAITTSGCTAYSDLDQLNNDVIDCQKRVATCEPNFWKLDGSTCLETTGETAFISDTQADSSGDFAAPVTITMELTHEINLDGTTIIFSRLDDEYAEDFTVEYYDDTDALVATETVTGNDTPHWTVATTVTGIDKLVLTITKWSVASHRARVSEIALGLIQSWGHGGEASLISCNTQDEVDITNTTLPYGDAVAVIDNTDQSFNVLTPVGIAKYLREGRPMMVYHGVKVNGLYEFIKTGTYWFKSWQDAGNNTVKLTGVDTLGYYSDVPILFPYQIAPSTLWYAALDLDQAANIAYGYFEYSALDNVVTDYLDVDYTGTFGQGMRELAQFMMKIVTVDADGVIRFSDLPTADSLTVPLNSSRSQPKIEQAEQIAGVDISVYTKSVAATAENITTFAWTVSGGEETLSLDIGYYWDEVDVVVTGGTDFSFSGPASGKMSIWIEAAGAVTVTVTGKKITLPKQIISVDNASVTDPNAKRLTIDNRHVMTVARATAIANWTIANYNQWYKWQLSWIGDPRLEVLDQVSVGNRYGADRAMIVTKQATSFSGAISQETDGRGS